ncbi:hypothetical protein BH11ARM2_BH11ARM2_12200 [soil metagenome]
MAAVLIVSANLVPGLRLLLLPLTYLNTHIHELCHALVAWGTGGQPQYILVRVDGSGVTPTAGGFTALIASAGYLGATFVGAGLILAARKEGTARNAIYALFGALALGGLLLVRGDVVGIVTLFLWLGILFAIARKADGLWICRIAGGLGAMQCLNGMRSLGDLWQVTTSGDVQSDAGIMQSVTGLPAIFWSLLWAVAGAAICFAALRRMARS